MLFLCWQKKEKKENKKKKRKTWSSWPLLSLTSMVQYCKSFSPKHFSYLLPCCHRIYLQWTTAMCDPERYIQVPNSFDILWELPFSTILKICRNHAEHICTPKRPVFPGNFNSFSCSLQPALTTALSGSLHTVPRGAEVGRAQHSVGVYLNLQLEKISQEGGL